MARTKTVEIQGGHLATSQNVRQARVATGQLNGRVAHPVGVSWLDYPIYYSGVSRQDTHWMVQAQVESLIVVAKRLQDPCSTRNHL